MSDLPMDVAAPNWAEISTEPQCPLCEYMLRGLNVAQCPECGFRFEWSEVLDASRREHPYLFEHHPDRNIWSYFKTLFGAMRPRRFWSQLHPAQFGSIKRLLIYATAQLTIVTAALLIQPLIQAAFDYAYNRYALGQTSPFFIWRPPNVTLATTLSKAISDITTWEHYGLFWVLIPAWPLVTHLSLLVFGISMRRAKIKPVHVLRCVLYSFDLLAPCLAIAACTGQVMLEIVRSYTQGHAGFWQSNFSQEAIPWLALFYFTINGYRLNVAYRRYLRFPHAPFVAVSSQVIAALVLAIFTLLPILW